MDTINLFREMSLAGIKSVKVDKNVAWGIAKSFLMLSLEKEGEDLDLEVESVFRYGAYVYGIHVEIADE